MKESIAAYTKVSNIDFSIEYSYFTWRLKEENSKNVIF